MNIQHPEARANSPRPRPASMPGHRSTVCLAQGGAALSQAEDARLRAAFSDTDNLLVIGGKKGWKTRRRSAHFSSVRRNLSRCRPVAWISCWLSATPVTARVCSTFRQAWSRTCLSRACCKAGMFSEGIPVTMLLGSLRAAARQVHELRVAHKSCAQPPSIYKQTLCAHRLAFPGLTCVQSFARQAAQTQLLLGDDPVLSTDVFVALIGFLPAEALLRPRALAARQIVRLLPVAGRHSRPAPALEPGLIARLQARCENARFPGSARRCAFHIGTTGSPMPDDPAFLLG